MYRLLLSKLFGVKNNPDRDTLKLCFYWGVEKLKVNFSRRFREYEPNQEVKERTAAMVAF